MTPIEKLAQISAILGTPDTPTEAWEHPELTAGEVIADGTTVNADGSTWDTSKGENGPVGTRVQVIYGYISKKKDPVMWDRMVRVFGGDEARLTAILAANGPMARYRTHPNAVIYQQGPSAFNLLSYVLAGALRAPGT